MNLCCDVYEVIEKTVGDDIWLNLDNDDNVLIDVFHSRREPEAQTRIPGVFRKVGCNLRIVITTVAFGMGMQIPDIDVVLHWGPSDNILMYWQEVGRCARDGRAGKAKLFLPPYALANHDMGANMKNYCHLGQEMCLRKFVLQKLQIEGISDQEIDAACGGPNCCSHCSK
jgi:ATP-dependent DNA helicase RecQ